MAFSRQDARYKPTPISLDDYTAADMMADLGIQRRSALPLAGRALIIPPPPPDINKRGPRLAKLAERNAGVPDAWSALYDPALAEDRDDGLGEGQMHRTGPNYRPVQPRQKSPPRIRRTQSVGLNESLFELGKRPGKAPNTRGFPEPLQIHRRLSERRRNRSPDELDGPPGDILAPLRMESMLKTPKSRVTRPVLSLVSHHLAGNPSIFRKAASFASSHSSRIIPDNPDVSHWNAGKLAIASKGGYDYISTSKKLSTGPSLFPTQMRESNHAVPTPLQPSIPPIPPRPAPGLSLFTSRPVPFTTSRSASPVPSESISFIIASQDVGWGGDRPFNSQPEVTKLIEVTNGIDRTSRVGSRASDSIESVVKPSGELTLATVPVVNLLNTITSTEGTNKLGSGKSSNDLAFNDPQEASSHTPQSRELLNPLYVVDNPENYDNNTDNENDGSADCNPANSVQELWSSLSDEDPDLTDLHRDFYTLRKDVERLRVKLGKCGDIESSLWGRMRLIHRIRKDILSELEREEEEIINIRHDIRFLRLNHINLVEGLRAKRMEAVGSEFSQMDDRRKVTPQVTLTTVAMAEPGLMESENVEMADVGEVNIVRAGEAGVKVKQARVVCLGAERFKKNHLMADLSKKEQLGGEILELQQFEGTRLEASEEEFSLKQQTKSPHMLNLPTGKQDSQFRDQLKRMHFEDGGDLEKERIEKACLEQRCLQTVGAGDLDALHVEQQHLIKEVGEEQYKTKDAQGTQEGEAEKEHLEKEHLQQQLLEREFYDNARTEVNHHSEITRLGEMVQLNENDRHEEQLLMKEHLEKTCLQEEHFEVARIVEARLESEKQGESTMGSQSQGVLKNEETLEGKLENMCLREESISVGHSKAENQTMETVHQQDGTTIKSPDTLNQREESETTTPTLELVNQQGKPKPPTVNLELVWLQEKPGVTITTPEPVNQHEEFRTGVVRPRPASEQGGHRVTPEHPSRPPSPTQLTTILRAKITFPYKIDLDLRPVFNVPPLRVKIVQHGRPQEAIVNDCKDLLTPTEFETLNVMPHFQQFLVNCNERHTRKLARFYGNTGEY